MEGRLPRKTGRPYSRSAAAKFFDGVLKISFEQFKKSAVRVLETNYGNFGSR
jgi:hypothetical protein